MLNYLIAKYRMWSIRRKITRLERILQDLAK